VVDAVKDSGNGFADRSSERKTMALDDFLEPEVGVAVVVTAAVASPRVRKMLRQGLVYGLAGLLIAGEKLKSAASGVAQRARDLTAASATNHETPNYQTVVTSEPGPS
jgi:hypothetical protein